MPNLIDVFMPNDLCARCDEQEPSPLIDYMIKRPHPEKEGFMEVARLTFCTEACKTAFVKGAAAVKELPDAF